MPNDHALDIARLEKRHNDLVSVLARLDLNELRELVKTFKKPGWTTPAEFRFAMGLTEGLIAQVEALDSFKNTLIQGSRLVGSGSPALAS